ncbi:MAG: N-acetyl sugar amidotransferase [Bdellovibrionales bacterium]|nr:N-acetyl sugar amidotransferase [Bdellovibrionales bacterium]
MSSVSAAPVIQTAPQICRRCIIDERVPGAVFAADGTCSYCRIHDALCEAYPNDARGQQKLDELLERVRSDGKNKRYDCVVGVSGGTDSTYLLYYALSKGLRPLAVHFDNGWNSEIAVDNIRRSISALGVDLQTYVVDWEEFKDILRAHLKASIPWADAPTDLGLTAALYRIAQEEGVRHILVGNNFRSEGKQPTEWTYCDGRMIRAIVKRFGTTKLKSFPNLTISRLFWTAFVRRVRLVRPLYYIPYSKQDAKKLIEDKFGWRDYGGHHYESIFTRFVYSVYLPEKFGIDKRLISLSAQVRSGVMTREAALDEIARPPIEAERRESDMAYVAKKLGFSELEFKQILTAEPKSVFDYPSYHPMIRKFQRAARTAAKVLLPWTPMMFYEMDVRDSE